MRSIVILRLFAMVLFANLIVIWPTKAQPDQQQDVDEELFMIRALEELHLSIPPLQINSEKTKNSLILYQRKLLRHVEYVKQKGMDDKIIGMHNDSIEMAKKYWDLLVELGAIERKFDDESQEKVGDLLVDNFTEGGLVGYAMAAASIEPITATFIGAGFLLKKGVDNYVAINKFNNEKKDIIEKRMNNYLIDRSKLLGRIEISAQFIAENKKWKKREVGFSQNEDDNSVVIKAVREKNYSFLIEKQLILVNARPRDPFVYSVLGNLYYNFAMDLKYKDQNLISVSFLKSAKKQFTTAASLVPVPGFHDKLRGEILLNLSLVFSELSYYGTSEPDAIVFAEKASEFLSGDTSGRVAHAKAFAYARNSKIIEACNEMNVALSLDAENGHLLFEAACLFSVCNDLQSSLKALKKSWDCGIMNTRALKKNTDLINVRNKFDQHVNRLVKLDVKWAPYYGFLKNNMSFYNESQIPVSNLFIRSQWFVSESSKVCEVYWERGIEPYNHVTFYDVFSGALTSNSAKEKAEIQFLCDENRSSNSIGIIDAIGKYNGIVTKYSKIGGGGLGSRNASLTISKNQIGGIDVKMSDIDVEFDGEFILDSKFSSNNGGNYCEVFFSAKTAVGRIILKSGIVHVFWLEME